MPPDALAHAFEPPPVTDGPNAGTGSFLGQVYNMVRQAGGEVAVESALGEGTAVTIRLPRVQAAAVASASVAA
jgi:signal transduction histidine kinase